MSKICDYVEKSTIEYLGSMSKGERKKIGQFFTGKETAKYMASLFAVPSDKCTVSILDAGAGSGMLSAAIIDYLNTFEHIKKIDLICYENDEKILSLLKSNLLWISGNSNIELEYTICTGNYILEQQQDFNNMLGANLNPSKFDFVIGNPPYMKISKSAPEAQALSSVCYGAPNLYFLFATMGIFNLKTNGEMVYIIPRSWTSGAYFKRFREYLFLNSSIQNIHLFISRDKVFDKENVLQETIIIKVKKDALKPERIKITTSENGVDFSDITSFYAPYDAIVSGSENYVYLVSGEEEINILQTMHKWKDTLPKLGLKMKTGITVDFRNKEVLRSYDVNEVVPLFYSQHIQDGKVVFPIGKENEYITTEKRGLLQENKNYIFVKRFTSKEESRRLQCGIYLAQKYSAYDVISTQNKINFIDGLSELSECIVYGLYVLFNSTIYDRYYRILNGSTQVNSTEVNAIPVPPIGIIEEMGKQLISIHDNSERSCDRILRSYL